ncbi:MAG: PD-(D/E)XK nuclease family transposase [bacterium]|nr:PD-(D/E)XK nuclease family transposase [bacterium]MDY4100403.1 PD-(D/E)XK nuclease family transposase [Lachnospiraceae bacterium]
MVQQTHLGNTIDAVDPNKALYDKNIKELLADIQILAWIIKYTVDEVRQLEIQEIIKCIDAETIEVGIKPLDPGLTNAKRIENTQTENSIPNEGYVTFDIRLTLTYCEKTVKIIINVEAQKSTNAKKLGYHLENRIIFYLARLVSSQKKVEFFHSDYDSLKKVYSIWICMDGITDFIEKVSLVPKIVFGKPNMQMNFDKMSGVIVQLRAQKNLAESKNHLIAMLEDLLCKEEQEEKKKRLAQKYEMKMTVELERRLKDMCNLSDLVEERGIMLGKEQGKQEEIFSSVQEGDYSPERGAQKLKISLVEFQKRMLEAGYGNSWQ